MRLTLNEILNRVSEDIKYGCRFPVRVILAEDFSQYRELVLRLMQICDETLRLSEFCSTPDVYPNFFRLGRRIDALKGKRVLLLSMGEYLRLAARKESARPGSQFPGLWQRQEDSSSATRVIVPMYGCTGIFARVIPSVDERQTDFIWEMDHVSAPPKQFTLTVYSPAFDEIMPHSDISHGMRNWLENWEDKIPNGEHSIQTALFENAENTSGAVGVRVISDPFTYLKELTTDGHRLKREWGTDSQWAAIIRYCDRGTSLKSTILGALNLVSFDPLSILSQWGSMDEQRRWLAWLWYRLNQTGDYYGYVFQHASSPASIETDVCDSILTVGVPRADWIAQRAEGLKALKVEAIDESYFERLKGFPLPETRLALLTGRTHAERAFAARTIGEWLKKGASPDVVVEAIHSSHPLLAAYLEEDGAFPNDELKTYFSWYRLHKMQNICPEPASTPSVNLETYDSRFSRLKSYSGKDAVAFWVDGMGIEWLPLLLGCIRAQSSSACPEVDIVGSLLPTETMYNQRDDLGYPSIKWDRLDKLSHEGNPDDRDYFSCIDSQLTVISDVAKKAVDLLSKHDYVIITADHGSSRMAALSFHKTPGIMAPKDSEVRSFGRFCELRGAVPVWTEIPPGSRHVTNGERSFLVMMTHDHFSQSGNPAGGNDDENAVAGEVHGGMTPEECLVPVIVLKRSIPLAQLDYEIEDDAPYRTRDSVSVSLEFGRPISTLEVTSEAGRGTCSMVAGNHWIVTFPSVDLKPYTLDVVADGKLLGRHHRFTVQAKGIAHSPDPFGGRR